MAMYSEMRKVGKRVCLCCDECDKRESENLQKCKKESSPGPMTKCDKKRIEVDDLVSETEINHDKCSFSSN